MPKNRCQHGFPLRMLSGFLACLCLVASQSLWAGTKQTMDLWVRGSDGLLMGLIYEYIDEFEKKHNVKFNLSYPSTKSVNGKLLEVATQRSTLNAVLHNSSIAAFHSLLDLEAVNEQLEPFDLEHLAKATISVGETAYGIPIAIVDQLVLLHDKKIAPQAPVDWSQLRNITYPGERRLLDGIVWPTTDAHFAAGFLPSLKNKNLSYNAIADELEKYYQLTQFPNVSVLCGMKLAEAACRNAATATYTNKNRFSCFAEERMIECTRDVFESSEAAFLLAKNTELDDLNIDRNRSYRVAPLPRLYSNQFNSPTRTIALFVPSSGSSKAEKQTLTKFGLFLLSDRVQNEIALYTHAMSVRKDINDRILGMRREKNRATLIKIMRSQTPISPENYLLYVDNVIEMGLRIVESGQKINTDFLRERTAKIARLLNIVPRGKP